MTRSAVILGGGCARQLHRGVRFVESAHADTGARLAPVTTEGLLRPARNSQVFALDDRATALAAVSAGGQFILTRPTAQPEVQS